MTPEQQFKEVVQVLRGMSLHGCADTIENAWEGLKSNHERVVSA